MCTDRCLDFARQHIAPADVQGKRVLEVGALDMNGTVRPIVETFEPAEYIGVDLTYGPGVDLVCDATKLVDVFGTEAFDLVISTEMIEHVPDWRAVISNFKRVLRPDGVLVVTTRSRGYPFHGAPYDFWRYEPSDMEAIFSDFRIEAIEPDDQETPGVFVRARRPRDLHEADLREIALYSVLFARPARNINRLHVKALKVVSAAWQFIRRRMPEAAAERLKDKLDRNRR